MSALIDFMSSNPGIQIRMWFDDSGYLSVSHFFIELRNLKTNITYRKIVPVYVYNDAHALNKTLTDMKREIDDYTETDHGKVHDGRELEKTDSQR